MSSRKTRRSPLEIIGNASAILLLALTSLMFLQWTRGDWWIASPSTQRCWNAAGVLAVYVGFCFWQLRRPSRRFGSNASDDSQPSLPIDPSSIAVVYASQTGFAFELAQQTALYLNNAGQQAQLAAIDQIDRKRLSHGGRLLMIASTTGEGDPPDHAYGFLEDVMGHSPDLRALEFAVLALGDRTYTRFCAFGRQIDHWLRRHQARPLFDLIEVDNGDAEAIDAWQTQVALAFAADPPSRWQPTEYEDWQLTSRVKMNPGSCGGSVYQLTLQPVADKELQWQAGDIVEIEPRNSQATVDLYLQQNDLDGSTQVGSSSQTETLAKRLLCCDLEKMQRPAGEDVLSLADSCVPLKHREYSIASLPSDGNLQLVLRRVVRGDGTLGICSGWLCDHLAIGGQLRMRIRTNPSFHPQTISRPLILIGNGTGIAGLRSHLKHRIAQGQAENWLLFGERQSDRDFFFRDELMHWQQQGFLKRLDLAFSRDSDQRVYVQDQLHLAADELRKWVQSDAAIYVCGSVDGMAPAVDAVIRETIGDDLVNAMLSNGRYRRDVY